MGEPTVHFRFDIGDRVSCKSDGAMGIVVMRGQGELGYNMYLIRPPYANTAPAEFWRGEEDVNLRQNPTTGEGLTHRG